MTQITPIIGKRYTLNFVSAIPEYAERAGQIGTVTGKRIRSQGSFQMWDVQTNDGWTGIVFTDELTEIAPAAHLTVVK